MNRSLLNASDKKKNANNHENRKLSSSSGSNEEMSDLTYSDEVDPFEDNRELDCDLKSLSEITINSFILVRFATKRNAKYYIAKA